MSRNFELMRQLEIDRGVPSMRTPTPDRPVVMPFASVSSSQPSDAGGDDMLRLVQRVFLSANGSAPRQVVFCGVDEKNGSSSICARAGRTLADKSARPVCLVDANFKSPHLAKMFGVNEPLSSFDPTISLREQCVKIGANLWLAGSHILADSGTGIPTAVQIKASLAMLRDAFDYVLIDTPGTVLCGDAQLLGRAADAAILVIEANSTRRLTARKAKDDLESAGVQLLGTVLHNRSFPIPEALYRSL